jgi:hypothetical protein
VFLISLEVSFIFPHFCNCSSLETCLSNSELDLRLTPKSH